MAGAAAGADAAVPAHMIGAVVIILLVVAHDGIVMALVGIRPPGAVAAVLIADAVIRRLAQGFDFLVFEQAAGRQRQQEQDQDRSHVYLRLTMPFYPV